MTCVGFAARKSLVRGYREEIAVYSKAFHPLWGFLTMYVKVYVPHLS